jgi:hypothetical protein
LATKTGGVVGVGGGVGVEGGVIGAGAGVEVIGVVDVAEVGGGDVNGGKVDLLQEKQKIQKQDSYRVLGQVIQGM